MSMRTSILLCLPVLVSCAPPPPAPMTTLSLEIGVEGALEVGKPVMLKARKLLERVPRVKLTAEADFDVK